MLYTFVCDQVCFSFRRNCNRISTADWPSPTLDYRHRMLGRRHQGIGEPALLSDRTELSILSDVACRRTSPALRSTCYATAGHVVSSGTLVPERGREWSTSRSIFYLNDGPFSGLERSWLPKFHVSYQPTFPSRTSKPRTLEPWPSTYPPGSTATCPKETHS